MGRESVSSDTAALFELVKNAYDADATELTITFENLLEGGGINARIILKDNGEGMTYVDIENKWMVIGTYGKEKQKITNMGRRVLGNKGIGRFSTEKLSKKTTIISRPVSSTEEITLHIDWDKYEDETVEFTQIKNPVEINPQRDNISEHGTTIMLENIREPWDEKKIQKLRLSIASILLPPELRRSQKEKFGVKIIANEFGSGVTSEIESLMFKKAPYKVSAAIPSGFNHTTMTIWREGKFVEKRSLSYEDIMKSNGLPWKSFGLCKVVFYFFPHSTRYDPWDEYYRDVLKSSEITSIVRDHHGIKIYRDGFWVSPYGALGNDWLSLEAQRVQSTLRVYNSQVIGFVEISREENPLLIDTTTREKLVENDAYLNMVYFVNDIFTEFFYFRSEERKRQQEKGTRVKHERVLESEIKYLSELVEENPQLDKTDKKVIQKSLNKISKVFTGYRDDLTEEYQDLENRERTYRNLASLGISSAASYHEIFNIIAGIESTPDAISKYLKKLGINDSILDAVIKDLDDKIVTVSHFTWFIRKFVQGVGHSVESRIKEPIKIEKEMNDILDDFVTVLDYEIDAKAKAYPKDLTIFMNKADFLSIALNMLTNSVKALEKTNKKMIKVTCTKESHGIKMKFSDNGKGVSDSIRHKIFRPLFSEYENGTGLGLSIVQETVESYGGKVEILKDGELGRGATFVITIPWEKIKRG
ncbi:MAG: sensor histidine kinase [Thaumarchaeota archaeon]|nr:sensor histidine kinase [Nitrososphaerota archaeon]